MNMNKNRIALILQTLIFLIPLNIYMWGDWIIVDLQWALFRYQQSPYGNSLIIGTKDINYILLGQTTGMYNILATLFWTAGSILLIIGLLIIILANIDERSTLMKMAAVFTVTGGIFSVFQHFYGSMVVLPFLSVCRLSFLSAGGCIKRRLCLKMQVRAG